MKLFLTSSIGGSYFEDEIRMPCAFDDSNNFLSLLRTSMPENSKCLILSSDPENDERNDSYKSVYTEAFRLSELPLIELDICDSRNESRIADMLHDYDVLLLAGGHVTTQNQFFDRINLKTLMTSYKGVVIGISAGTMNCADVVYAQPEWDGEATNPDYQRYLKGLNLTELIILPHFQDLNELSVDGLRVIEDISLPDSWRKPFYGLVDGSFVIIEDNKSTLYGEAYWVQDGRITKVCEMDQSLQLV